LTLLDRVRANDEQAWTRFVYLYTPLIYHWCRQAGLREQAAEDVGQEVFRAVSGAIAGFRHDRQGDTFRGWLRTITRNKVRDYCRRNRPHDQGVGGSDAQTRMAELPDEVSTDAEAAAADDRLVLLRRAVELVLADCEEITRTAFQRVVFDGHAVEDVARDLGLTRNAIYVAKSRILKLLREEFAGLVELKKP
jgi:RNA polymerase sigma-70 factor (ECF subfamily)